MKGIFNHKGSYIKYGFGLAVALFGILASINMILKGELIVPDATMILFFVFCLLIIVFCIVGIVFSAKRRLDISDEKINYNGTLYQMSEVISVISLSSLPTAADVSVTFKSGKTVVFKSLTNHAEIADFIKSRIKADEIANIDEAKKEIASLEKKSRVLLALTIAVFFALSALFVILIIMGYRNEGGLLNKNIALIAIDVIIVSIILWRVAKAEGSALGLANGKKLALRKSIIDDEPENPNWIKVISDNDYYLRLTVIKENGKYRVISEIIAEDYTLHKFDTTDEYPTEQMLLEEIDMKNMHVIKSK